jgi:hypothetical protein
MTIALLLINQRPSMNENLIENKHKDKRYFDGGFDCS